jgi:hypothetical protein
MVLPAEHPLLEVMEALILEEAEALWAYLYKPEVLVDLE